MKTVKTVKNEDISLSVIRRLPRYYRFLQDLEKNGVERISSGKLSGLMGLTASQIRQDLNCFGGFGQQGYGYNTKFLYEEIGRILGLENRFNSIMIGAGNLGRAVAAHTDFQRCGFNLLALFDCNKAIIGQKVNDFDILDVALLEDFCKEHSPKAAILCIPKQAAEDIAERLIKSGIYAFWNFGAYDLTIKHKDIVVENVHLSRSLMTLCYRIKNTDTEN